MSTPSITHRLLGREGRSTPILECPNATLQEAIARFRRLEERLVAWVEDTTTGGNRAIFVKKNVQMKYFWQPSARFRLVSLYIVNKNLAQQVPTIWETLGKLAAQEK